MSARFIRFVTLFSVGVGVAAVDTQAADYVFAPVGNSTRRDLPENWVPYGGPTGPNDREVSIADARGTGQATATAAQIPDGYELVWITNDPDLDDSRAEINNCGEIVFSSVLNDGVQIRLYDNGLIRQLTFDDGVENRHPNINNDGTIVWQHDQDELEHGDIVVWNAGQVSVVGFGIGPAINDPGQMTWKNRYETGCFGADADMFLYDDGVTTQLTEDFLSNQLSQMNAHGDVVWTHYNFCPVPWESTTAYYDGNEIQLLPTHQIKALAPDITEDGIIAWGGDDGIEIWQDGETSLLTNWGRIPRLNERGDISFIRWHDENSTWQVWLYSNEQYYQLTETWSTSSEINDHGEVVFTTGEVQERLLRLLRRIRNGDIDFDGKVSVADYSTFPDCATGPFETDRLCDCRFLDIDRDRDVDLRDYAQFANGFGEP